MVIQQFNRLIRNKWFWGAFAVIVSAAFCFEGLFDTRQPSERREIDAGSLSGKPIDSEEFGRVATTIRAAKRNSEAQISNEEVNSEAAEQIAAVETAKRIGVRIPDSMLAERIVAMFGGRENFDSERYRAFVMAQLGLAPETFEENIRRNMMIEDGLHRSMASSAVWVSPMEIDRTVEDLTDVFTVKVAEFRQDKAAADAVKLDEAGLKKWYDANLDRIALPELVQIRFVKYSVSDTNVLAKMTVTDDDMHDYYDANTDKYTKTDTNGVETVKSFDEVKGDIEKELRKIEAANYYETNLSRRAYAPVAKTAKPVSRLDAIAAEDGKKVETSGWFALDGKHVEGFTVRRDFVLPGASNFTEAVAELDPESEDLRYGIVVSPNAVWLVERSGFAEARKPSFEESKGKIDAMALRDAKADAFKAQVEATIAKGADAFLAIKEISTNITFSVNDLQRNAFKNAPAVAKAAMKLSKGGISEFVSTGPGRAIAVYCVDRVTGDAAKALLVRSGVRNSLSSGQLSAIAENWDAWNLARLGFVAGSDYPVKPAEETKDGE